MLHATEFLLANMEVNFATGFVEFRKKETVTYTMERINDLSPAHQAAFMLVLLPLVSQTFGWNIAEAIAIGAFIILGLVICEVWL